METILRLIQSGWTIKISPNTNREGETKQDQARISIYDDKAKIVHVVDYKYLVCPEIAIGVEIDKMAYNCEREFKKRRQRNEA